MMRRLRRRPGAVEGRASWPRRSGWRLEADAGAGGGFLGHIDGTERNRASPQAICKLYKHINEDQRAAIRDMEDKLKATTVISKFASGVGTLFNKFASGVDTLLTELVQGLTAPATRNTTTSRIKRGTEERESDDTSSEDSAESDNDTNEDNVDIERDKKKRVTREEDITRGNVESPLTKNARDVAGEMENTTYDPSQGANFFGGAREAEVCDNTSSGDLSAQFDTKSPSRSTSHMNLPSDSDMCSPDNNSPADTLVSLISEGNSEELEEKIRGSAAGLANRLRELKSTRPADIEQGDGSTHEEIKRIVVKELGLLKETCGKCPESTKEDGEKKRKHVQQAGVNVSIKRKSIATLTQPSPKRQATRRSPRLARITSSNVTGADVSHAPMEQSSSRSSANKATGFLATTRSGRIQMRSPGKDGSSSNTPITISPKMSPRTQPSTGIGESKCTVIILSPTADTNTHNGNKVGVDVATTHLARIRMRSLVKDGSSSSTAIVVSPEISQTTQPTEIDESKSTAIILSPAVNTNVHVGSGSSSSSTRISPLGKRILRHMTNDGKSTPIPEHVLNVIKDLSESAKRLGMFQGKKYDSTGAIPKTQAANANKRSHGSSSDKARDNRPGAFTPPSFSLGFSPIPSNPSNEVNIDYEHLDAGNPLEIMPLSWAQPTVVETGLQMVEYPLLDKLTAFLATGDQDEIDADLAEELDDYERHLEDFFKKKRAAATTAGAARSNNMAGETGVQSVTPKTNPHKERVKKPSRFKLSPYDDDINVTSEEEDIYKKLMLSSKYKKNGNSLIKK
ncbi:hypothetical protein ZWY2020_000937 [Hordeum vulgare]|nr:hypothetical protein ZWY2020_000937 [Hordeum vulgare]